MATLEIVMSEFSRAGLRAGVCGIRCTCHFEEPSEEKSIPGALWISSLRSK